MKNLEGKMKEIEALAKLLEARASCLRILEKCRQKPAFPAKPEGFARASIVKDFHVRTTEINGNTLVITYSGQMENGEPNGRGALRTRMNCGGEEVAIGTFKNGLSHGQMVVFRSDLGQVSEANYIEGNSSGQAFTWFSNGSVLEGQYKNGKRNGQCITWYADALVDVCHYVDDKNTGVLRYYPGSSIVAKGTFVQGQFQAMGSLANPPSRPPRPGKRRPVLEEAIRKLEVELEAEMAKRRFDEYWAAHKPEKAKLESEKKSLDEQIAALSKEISEIPQNTDGYAELQKKIRELTSQKDTLIFFKFKEKKAIQKQIDSANNEIAPIQARINSAIEIVKSRMSALESRIKDINTELTKPR